MTVVFQDTMPAVRTVAISFDYTLWSSINQSVAITAASVQTPMDSTVRLLGVSLEKSTPLNTGALKLGHGTVSAHRETLGTGTEIDATAAGTSRLEAWRTSTDGTIVGGFNNLLIAGARVLYARFEGASLPTQGAFVLYLHVQDVQGRASP